ncbi:MAG: nucleotidyltransferase family protein, partial [Spirochaetota bacterium]
MHPSFELAGSSRPGEDGYRLLATASGLVRGVVPPEAVDQAWLRGGLQEMDGALAWEAVRHKVGALVLAWMRQAGIKGKPKVVSALKAKLMADSSARMLLLRHWPALVGLLADEGVPCLTLKGPAASMQFHRDPAEREYVDLDLLVDLPDPVSLAPVLARAGFYPMDGFPQSGIPQSGRRYFQPVHHAVFLHRELPMKVEIHGSEGFQHHEEFFPVPASELFRRAVELTFRGQAILTLDPVDHALFMVAHGILHAWGLLHWALDAAAILSPSRAHLHPQILARGRELGMERMLAVSALVVERTFGSPLPEGFAELAGDRRFVPVPALRHCLRRLRSGSRGGQSTLSILRHSFFHLGTIAGGRGFAFHLLA